MNYKFPNPKDILNVSNQSDNDNEDIKQHQLQIINRVLLNHNISCECNNIIDAANVFLYDFEIFNFGISFNKIKALEKSLQMFLQSNDITINFSQANVGFTISVPKQKRQLITTGDCLINMQSHFNTMIVPLGLDEYNNPFVVVEAKKEDIHPLDAKEQARKYANSLRCKYVILTNGSIHYFWNLEKGNPEMITTFPTYESLKESKALTSDTKTITAMNIDKYFVALSQDPSLEVSSEVNPILDTLKKEVNNLK